MEVMQRVLQCAELIGSVDAALNERGWELATSQNIASANAPISTAPFRIIDS